MGVIVCCVWDSLILVCGSECVLCVGQFAVDFGRVSLCCVWDSLVWNWGVFVFCVWDRFCVGFWE